MIAGASPPHHDIAAVTDAAGAFTMGNLTPGAYTFMVNAIGCRTTQEGAEVTGGEETAIDVTMHDDDHG